MHLLLEMFCLPVFLIIDKVPHVLAHREETNLMYRGPLFPSFKILLVFFDRIFFWTLLVLRAGMCFWWCSCGSRYGFTKSKMKK